MHAASTANRPVTAFRSHCYHITFIILLEWPRHGCVHHEAGQINAWVDGGRFGPMGVAWRQDEGVAGRLKTARVMHQCP